MGSSREVGGPNGSQSAAASRARAITEARAKLVWGEQEEVVLGKLLESGVPRREAEALIKEVLDELRADTRKSGGARLFAGVLGALLGLVIMAYYARFYPFGMGDWLLGLGLPHAERELAARLELAIGPAFGLAGLGYVVSGVMRLLFPTPRFNR